MFWVCSVVLIWCWCSKPLSHKQSRVFTIWKLKPLTSPPQLLLLCFDLLCLTDVWGQITAAQANAEVVWWSCWCQISCQNHSLHSFIRHCSLSAFSPTGQRVCSGRGLCLCAGWDETCWEKWFIFQTPTCWENYLTGSNLPYHGDPQSNHIYMAVSI